MNKSTPSSTQSAHPPTEMSHVSNLQELINAELHGKTLSAIVKADTSQILAVQVGSSDVDTSSAGPKAWTNAVTSADGVMLLLSTHEGIHGFEDGVLCFHHFSAKPVAPIKVSNDGVAIFTVGNSVVRVAMRATRSNVPWFNRQVISVPAPVVGVDAAAGMMWILSQSGAVGAVGKGLSVQPSALDARVTPLGVVACRDGKRAFVACANASREVVFYKCRLDLESAGVHIETKPVDTNYEWAGAPAIAADGCLALLCRDEANPKSHFAITAGVHENDVFVSQNEIELKDIQKQLKGPVSRLRLHAVSHTKNMITVVWSANDRLMGMMSLAKEHSGAGAELKESVVHMEYCMLTVDTLDLIGLVLTAKPITSSTMNEVHAGTGMTLMSTDLVNAISDTLMKRAEVAANALRSQAKAETGSSFTTGAVQKLTLRCKDLRSRLATTSATLAEKDSQIDEGRDLVRAAGQRQQELTAQLAEARKHNQKLASQVKRVQRHVDSSKAELASMRATVKQAVEEGTRAAEELKAERTTGRAEAQRLRAQLRDCEASAQSEVAKLNRSHREAVAQVRQAFADRKASLMEEVDAKLERQREEHAKDLAAERDRQREEHAKDLAAERDRLREEHAKEMAAERDRVLAQHAKQLDTARGPTGRTVSPEPELVAQKKIIEKLKAESAQLRFANQGLHTRIAFWDQVLHFKMMPDGTPLPTAIEQLPQLAVFQQQVAALELQVQALVAELAVAREFGGREGKGVVTAGEAAQVVERA